MDGFAVGGNVARRLRLRPLVAISSDGLSFSDMAKGLSTSRMNDNVNQDAGAKKSWWQRLSGGLKRTSASIGGAIADLVTKRKLDAGTIEELEEVLIRADLGVATAAKIAACPRNLPSS